MGNIYPSTKGDFPLEVKGVLNDGGLAIVNFVIGEAFEDRFHALEALALQFKGKLKVTARRTCFGKRPSRLLFFRRCSSK
ncbi:MAG: hypothetical protein WCI27_04020 [Candidatus Omnitrophota bacterium]